MLFVLFNMRGCDDVEDDGGITHWQKIKGHLNSDNEETTIKGTFI